MIFETKRLILRPWEESDAESLYEYAKDPEVGPIAGWPIHTSVENSKEIIRHVLSAKNTFAVCLKEDNRAIGSVGLIPPAQSHTKASENEIEIGYWIGVPFWGKGFIPEAVRCLQKYAFEELGYQAMWCGYYDGNEKSKKCQEKCGFRYHHTEYGKPCIPMSDVRTEHFTRIEKREWESNKKDIVVYIHGKGGSAEEAKHYHSLFPQMDVVGFDYKATTPWDCKDEFLRYITDISMNYDSVILIANSIGAFFSLNSFTKEQIERAYFISPIVDMENMITNMMQWENVTSEQLKEKEIISTSFGEDLSWEYLQYVKSHSIDNWDVKTHILYGENDSFTSKDIMKKFAQKIGATVTIMKNGEHWFHTEEQMEFLDNWIVENEYSDVEKQLI